MDKYEVEVQDWRRWPKALMMRREWSTNGHDHRREVRRYIPSEAIGELAMENRLLESKANACRASEKQMECRLSKEQQDKLQVVGQCNSLRARLHDMAGDRDRYKAENAKLRELLALATDMARDYDGDRRALRRLVRDMFGQLLNAYDWKELDDFADRMRELGVEVG